MKINTVIDRTNYILLDTISTEYIQHIFLIPLGLPLYVMNACEQFCIMMIIRASNMPKTEHDLKAGII